MDTPGILDREISLHNEIEHLTYATLMHFPEALLIYVIDPTSLAGEFTSSIVNQLNIRSYLKTTFPNHSWVDVITKNDLFGSSSALQKEFLSIVNEYNNAAAHCTVTDASVTSPSNDAAVQFNAESCLDGDQPFTTTTDSSGTTASTAAYVNKSHRSLNGDILVRYPYEQVIHLSAYAAAPASGASTHPVASVEDIFVSSDSDSSTTVDGTATIVAADVPSSVSVEPLINFINVHFQRQRERQQQQEK